MLKKDPLLKIKITGIYNQNYQHFYYRNPVTGCWSQVGDDCNQDSNKGNLNDHFDLFKNIAFKVKKIADRFYEDSKELFGKSQEKPYQLFP